MKSTNPTGCADCGVASRVLARSLLKGLRPWLSAKEIMQVIRFTADDVNADGHPGADTFLGYGRVNMERALVPYKLEGAAR